MTNKELADYLRKLQVFLTIAGYDEMHARRYIHIASEIEDLEEPAEDLAREGRLKEIQGVGPSTAGYIKEILETGTCSKQKDWEKEVPWSIVELVRMPGLGTRTAKKLHAQFGIATLADLKSAIENGRIAEAEGVGEKTIERWKAALEKNR